LCGSEKLGLLIDLGFHPLADTFLKPEQLNEAEPTYPLRVLQCESCGYTMSQYVVSPEKRYQENEYSYDSSNSKVAIKHFEEMASDVIERAGVTGDDLVVDIGSNVGTLLEAFHKKSDCLVLGVEPAPNMAARAKQNGVPTIQDFFNGTVASKILGTGKVKAVTITNAWNHVEGLTDFMEQVKRILAPDGMFVTEVPYLSLLVQKIAFDTIYLEHVSYFSIKPLIPFFKKFGFSIVDLQENDYMGGSIRISAMQGTKESVQVQAYVKREEEEHLYNSATYSVFMDRVRRFKADLVGRLYRIKKDGGHIVGIGAATKGNTLLNYCKIDNTLLDFVTDSSAFKIGKYTPGSHIPIKSDESIGPEITHALILPWNIGKFLQEKLGQLSVDFIVPEMGSRV
jgi:SAM-dependent methyltransferase